MVEDYRLTDDEINSCFNGTLTKEQREIIKDFMALATVIAYEGLVQKNKEQVKGE